MQSLLIVLAEFSVVLALSYVGVECVRRLAERLEILDVPNERSSHVKTVPRGGGLTIVIFSLAAAWLFNYSQGVIGSRPLIAYTIGAGLIVAISWLDDLRSQPTWLRFTIHGAAAIIVLFGFGFHLGSWGAGLVAGVTFIWIVGLTNAYNFMDGIDGIAAGQALVASLGWAAVGALSVNRFVTLFGLVLAASSLGFLLHNWPPAKIFMGDVGSAFLGYTFAVIPLMLGTAERFQSAKALPFVLGIILVWPFVFDSSFTLLRRLLFRENVFKPHRSHLYQRLVIVGYSHRNVSLIYVGMAIIGLVLALIGLKLQGVGVLLAFVLSALCLTLWMLVTRTEQRAGSLRGDVTRSSWMQKLKYRGRSIL